MALPLHMRADDPAAADPARRRLAQHSSFPRFPSFPSHSHPSKISLHSLPPPPTDDQTDDILIHDPALPLPSRDKDVFRWAILYENQRGITLFSTPFYSSLSLFLTDPYPFTLPNVPRSGPNLSLDNYPLPDGTWRWVSSAWMIDMRTNRGEVQHDGFEYNWSFHNKNWHAKIGRLSTGAWVRRRRWVRLMMRPAIHNHNGDHSITPSRSSSSPSLLNLLSNHAAHPWDGSEHDWQHLQRLIKQLGRDGRKLELWQMWLAPYSSDGKGKGKQSDALSLPSQRALEEGLSDVLPDGKPPPLEHLITILRNHGEAILHSFIFPDSRAQFLELVRRARLTEDLESCLGHAPSVADVDFCSYINNLNGLSMGHTD